jgi:hypothetical protein
MTKKEKAYQNWENNRLNNRDAENVAYETWLSHDKENKKLWEKFMELSNESRRLYAIYLRERDKEGNK